MDGVNDPQIGIVVPTLGTRPDYLTQSLRSIREAGKCHIVIVAPVPEYIKNSLPVELYDAVIEDPKNGLPQAINAGIYSFPKNIKFASWLGDDDLLSPESLTITSQALQKSPSAVCAYGGCSYIGPSGSVLWVNKSGRYAKWLMRFGPQLIPQPGSLFTMEAFKEVGGLDPSFKWAFDLDLLLKFSQHGKLLFIPKILSSFRWHDGSLSVGGRQGSVNEASKIRRMYLPVFLQGLSPLWEFFIRHAIFAAGTYVSRKTKHAK